MTTKAPRNLAEQLTQLGLNVKSRTWGFTTHIPADDPASGGAGLIIEPGVEPNYSGPIGTLGWTVLDLVRAWQGSPAPRQDWVTITEVEQAVIVAARSVVEYAADPGWIGLAINELQNALDALDAADEGGA